MLALIGQTTMCVPTITSETLETEVWWLFRFWHWSGQWSRARSPRPSTYSDVHMYSQMPACMYTQMFTDMYTVYSDVHMYYQMPACILRCTHVFRCILSILRGHALHILRCQQCTQCTHVHIYNWMHMFYICTQNLKRTTFKWFFLDFYKCMLSLREIIFAHAVAVSNTSLSAFIQILSKQSQQRDECRYSCFSNTIYTWMHMFYICTQNLKKAIFKWFF